MTTAIVIIVGFLFASLASQHVGKLATRLKMPLITGYLLAGAVVGPFILGWISQEDVRSLRVVDQISLGFIAFAAGGELYLKEVRSRLKSIGLITAGLVLSTFFLGVVAILLIADHVPFMRDLPLANRLAMGLLAAVILVARSPSSAIAIIAELRARGPYTKTALGVTVVMDAVVILLFATNASISHSLVGSGGFDPLTILLVVLNLIISLNVGYLVGRLLGAISSTGVNSWIKTALILALGLSVFWFSHGLKHFSADHLSLAIAPEPLLICMIGGFVVTNRGRARNEFSAALHQVGPVIYLVFFTLVGASLALDVLVRLWPLAVFLFLVRLVGIGIGSCVGGLLAKIKPQNVRLGWMAYVTQAGVGLGLAKEVGASFPSFGTEFVAMIIAVIVLNQIVGPPLFKFAIKRVGESHLPAESTPDEVRDALILGIDDQSLAVARQLKEHGWKVIMADTNESHMESLASSEDMEEHIIADVDEESLSRLVSSSTDALVAMMEDDVANLRACELGYEKLGIPRLVVRLNDLSLSDKFEPLGALIVEPSSAMVNLLDQFVRVPHLATLFLHRDPRHEVVQVTVADPDIIGLPLRDLRLPPTVRVLGITRDGQPIVPYGYSVLRRNDEVTLVGERSELEKVVGRWGY